MSPVCTSVMGELNEENIATCESYLQEFVGRWFDWIDEAEKNHSPPKSVSRNKRTITMCVKSGTVPIP